MITSGHEQWSAKKKDGTKKIVGNFSGSDIGKIHICYSVDMYQILQVETLVTTEEVLVGGSEGQDMQADILGQFTQALV